MTQYGIRMIINVVIVICVKHGWVWRHQDGELLTDDGDAGFNQDGRQTASAFVAEVITRVSAVSSRESSFRFESWYPGIAERR